MNFFHWYLHTWVPHVEPAVPYWMGVLLLASAIPAFGYGATQFVRYLMGYDISSDAFGAMCGTLVYSVLLFLPPMALLVFFLLAGVGAMVGTVMGITKIRDRSIRLRREKKNRQIDREVQRQYEEKKRLEDPYYQYGQKEVEKIVSISNVRT